MRIRFCCTMWSRVREMGCRNDPRLRKVLASGEVGRIKRDRLSHTFGGRWPVVFYGMLYGMREALWKDFIWDSVWGICRERHMGRSLQILHKPSHIKSFHKTSHQKQIGHHTQNACDSRSFYQISASPSHKNFPEPGFIPASRTLHSAPHRTAKPDTHCEGTPAQES